MKKSSFSTLKALNQLILHLLYSKGHTKLPGYLSSMVVYVGIQNKVIFDQMIRFLDLRLPFFFTHLGSFLCILRQTVASLICLNFRPQNLAQLLPQIAKNGHFGTKMANSAILCYILLDLDLIPLVLIKIRPHRALKNGSTHMKNYTLK